MLNAFSVGDRDHAVIALTDGILRRLDLRELAGVLAHEISHIRNRDLWLMSLADLVGRLARVMTLLGLSLVIIGLPIWLGGGAQPPGLLILLLLFAPQLTVLLQLALSRAREFDADLDAAGLTGDPKGLISALAKLEHHQRGFWEQILMPGQRLPEPSLLRSHPPTEERIARLQALYGSTVETRAAFAAGPPMRPAARPVGRPPHGRVLGYWH
jgi:heat shock protein HtpX